MSQAHKLTRAHPPIRTPARACGAAPVEESEILARWLREDTTLLVRFEGPFPLSTGLAGTDKFRVPKPYRHSAIDVARLD